MPPQIEALIQAERHDAGGSPRRSNSGDNPEHAVTVHAQVVLALRKREHTIELVALHPILKLAGPVARVGATLEHCDDDHFHGHRLRLGRCERNG